MRLFVHCLVFFSCSSSHTNMLYILLATIIGLLAGTITGLTPGIHINLVSTFIITNLSLFTFQPLIFIAFIVSMSITHTFLDFIPSTLLGAPDSDTALSVLPAHRYLLKGRAYEAIKLTIIGSLFSLILAIILSPIIIYTIKMYYQFIQKNIPFLLIAISALLIIREKSRFWALFIFMLSGTLGLIVLNSNINQPLLPLLSGLFGSSLLVLSYKNKTCIPKQEVTELKLKKKTLFKALLAIITPSVFTSFLPALGSSQTAIIGSQLFKTKTKSFLIMIGGINTFEMLMSFLALFTLNKARSGSAVAISKLISPYPSYFIFIVAIALITAGLATMLSIKLSKIAINLIQKINYQKLCFYVLALLSLVVWLFSGFGGLLVLVVSTSIGFIPSLTKMSKHHLMGALILPTVLYFL